MRKITTFAALAVILAAGAALRHDRHDSALWLTPSEKQTLRDAPNEDADAKRFPNGRSSPENTEIEGARAPRDSKFAEFLDALSRIRSNYEDLRGQGDAGSQLRGGPIPEGAALRPDPKHGPDFANLPLELKLQSMKEEAAAEMAQVKLRHAERKKAYEKELARKELALEKAVKDIRHILAGSGEPSDLVERFRDEWLSADVFYRHELRRTYFASGLPENEAPAFLEVVFQEFKRRRAAKHAK